MTRKVKQNYVHTGNWREGGAWYWGPSLGDLSRIFLGNFLKIHSLLFLYCSPYRNLASAHPEGRYYVCSSLTLVPIFAFRAFTGGNGSLKKYRNVL